MSFPWHLAILTKLHIHNHETFNWWMETHYDYMSMFYLKSVTVHATPFTSIRLQQLTNHSRSVSRIILHMLLLTSLTSIYESVIRWAEHIDTFLNNFWKKKKRHFLTHSEWMHVSVCESTVCVFMRGKSKNVCRCGWHPPDTSWLYKAGASCQLAYLSVKTGKVGNSLPTSVQH